MPFQPKQHNIDGDVLQSHFHLPMAQVAKKFDVCLTFFKKICRQHGIKRWPYRKLKSLEKKITTLTDKLDGTAQRNLEKLNDQLSELRDLKVPVDGPSEEEVEDEDSLVHRDSSASQRPVVSSSEDVIASLECKPKEEEIAFSAVSALAQLAASANRSRLKNHHTAGATEETEAAKSSGGHQSPPMSSNASNDSGVTLAHPGNESESMLASKRSAEEGEEVQSPEEELRPSKRAKNGLEGLPVEPVTEVIPNMGYIVQYPTNPMSIDALLRGATH